MWKVSKEEEYTAVKVLQFYLCVWFAEEWLQSKGCKTFLPHVIVRQEYWVVDINLCAATCYSHQKVLMQHGYKLYITVMVAKIYWPYVTLYVRLSIGMHEHYSNVLPTDLLHVWTLGLLFAKPNPTFEVEGFSPFV